MAGTSFLSAADIVAIDRIQSNTFATLVALDPYDLTLFRFNTGSGQYEALPVQRVVKSYISRRAAREATSETAEAQFAEGTFEKDVPFDVRKGDRFEFTGGQAGVITRVPDGDGITQVAEWVVDEGRA